MARSQWEAEHSRNNWNSWRSVHIHRFYLSPDVCHFNQQNNSKQTNKTQQEQTSNFVDLIRGRSGERQIIKAKKERNEQPNSGTSEVEIMMWYSNADV